MKNPGLDHLSNGLITLVEAGHPVMAGSADLQYSNGLNRFAERYPDRYVGFGISEQNMVSAAAGIATTGMMPYVATFASFLGLLTCEQIRMDVAYCALPVRLIGHHTGISMGFYGTSHHATEDIGTMRSIADLTVVSTADGPQLEAAIRAGADYDQPIYFRTGRGREPDLYDPAQPFVFGKAIEHARGEEVTIIACGLPVHPSVQVAKKLAAEGRSVGVIDMATVKPIDRDEEMDFLIIDEGRFSTNRNVPLCDVVRVESIRCFFGLDHCLLIEYGAGNMVTVQPDNEEGMKKAIAERIGERS